MKRMSFYTQCIVCLVVTFLSVYEFAADDYNKRKYGVSGQLEKTITVDLNGAGGYKTVQSAIDSVPVSNQKWIHIFIKSGIYREKVTIPKEKGYIYMQGDGIEKTIIASDDHQATDTSATFTANPDNIVISGITFKNTYNVPLVTHLRSSPVVPAVAARMLGDKYVVIDSSFDGLQDTLFDALGRHYYKRCVISGGIDIIFGYAQSLFEGCTLNLTVGIYAPERPYGAITAQGRKSPKDNGGFVFKDCTVCSTVTGKEKALLGRAWEPYARVIFYRSNFCDVILPIGWDAWKAKGQEADITFVEYGCTGAGAEMSGRVPWMKKESEQEVLKLANVSFIDQDGWLNSIPIKV